MKAAKEFNHQPLMLCLPDVASELRCSLRTVQSMASRGEIKTVRIGRMVRVRRKDFEDFIINLKM